MTKRFICALFIALIVSSPVTVARKQAYVQQVLTTILDMGNTDLATRTNSGTWIEVNRRSATDNAGAWGNSACCGSVGGDCVTGDWFIWWNNAYWVPVVCSTCEQGEDLRGLVPSGPNENMEYILERPDGE